MTALVLVLIGVLVLAGIGAVVYLRRAYRGVGEDGDQ